jgi:hypothetical protein
VVTAMTDPSRPPVPDHAPGRAQADCFLDFNVALHEIKAGNGTAEHYATVALGVRYVAELRATPRVPAPLASARRPSR